MRFGLVDNWKKAHRWASVQLGALVATAVYYFLQFPDAALSVLNALPPEFRSYLSGPLAFVVFGLLLAVRIVKLKPKDGASNDGTET